MEAYVVPLIYPLLPPQISHLLLTPSHEGHALTHGFFHKPVVLQCSKSSCYPSFSGMLKMVYTRKRDGQALVNRYFMS